MTSTCIWPAGGAAAQQARPKDRLLKDMGLSPEQAFGPSRAFWSEWRRVSEPWQL